MTFVGTTTTLDCTRICDGLRAAMAQPGRSRGLRVLSAYRSAVNLLARDGALIAVVTERVGGQPDGIVVADGPDLRALGIRPGMAGRLTANTLTLGSAGVVIPLGRARPWSPRVPRLDARRWAARSALAHELVERHRVRGGIVAIAEAQPALSIVATAIEIADRGRAANAARQLVGLGPGLTPSGDDVLAGVEVALHAVAHPSAGFLACALDDVEARTTTVSAALLRHAARGEAAERIQGLLAALLAPTTDHLEVAVIEMVRLGATSGSDILAGVLLGLDAATGVATGRKAA